ncbi:MAG: multicopper oxidase family protein [Acidimicrobiales bacterium]
MVRDIDLTAGPVTVDLAGLAAATWAYNGVIPGAEVRVRAGEVLRARFVNSLPEASTVHWHGIALRNDMDGAAGVTQDAVPPGGAFLYEFTVPDPGTFWFHPHVGLQLDRGLYAPLIVEDPNEPGGYDRELVIVLDDWVSGIGATPEDALEELRAGRGAHAAHGQGGPRSEALGGPGGDVSYPLFLMNGRPPRDPPIFDATPGERLRMRIINAGADSPFRVALAGHRLTVTHTDGFPVEPVTVDSLVIGMSERYDVLVTVAGSGSFALVAEAEAKGNRALGILRAGAGPASVPEDLGRLPELDRQLLVLSDLRAADSVAFAPAAPDRIHNVVLGGGTDGYRWTLNGRTARDGKPLDVREGERVRLSFENRTTMFHPMHLHGHTFQVVRPDGRPGPRKDSLIVLPEQRLALDFVADNPGQWVLHCHNVYHMEGGMETTVSYVK